jgi:carbamate kinase
MSRRIVVALGGNALLRRGEPLTEANQQRNAEAAALALAGIAEEDQLVVTHGNGPQVGLLALESEAYEEVPAYGLAVLGAESQGMIGFLLQQALRSAIPGRTVATLLTTVLVDASDEAFTQSTKPVGPVYSRNRARRLAQTRGWQLASDGDGFRRVVPSPEPVDILEMEAISVLVESDVLLICSGGGGVPVVEATDGRLRGVEAVVDKDLTSAMLAEKLHADHLLLLTDVSNVELNWGTPDAMALRETTVDELRQHSFQTGSMGPKVEAACRFVERTGRPASIGALSDAPRILAGAAGTQIYP